MSGKRPGLGAEGEPGRALRIPSPWGQSHPRSVRLAPDSQLVPAGTMRVLLKKSGRLEVVMTGFALEPWIANGARVVLDGTRRPQRGDLALCAVEGWGDIRRILARVGNDAYVTGLDACPGAREVIASDDVLAVVPGRRGAGGALGRAVAGGFPVWSRWFALRYWFRKIGEAPRFAGDAVGSVKRKYNGQVEGYTDMLSYPLGDDALSALLASAFPRGCSVLIAGSGAGGEAIH